MNKIIVSFALTFGNLAELQGSPVQDMRFGWNFQLQFYYNCFHRTELGGGEIRCLVEIIPWL